MVWRTTARGRTFDPREAGWALLAVFPSLAFGLHAVATANFSLIDDGVTLRVAQGPLLHGDAPGRFRPLYWLYNWLLVHLLPAKAWSFALGNLVVLTLAVWLCYRLARTISGRWAGVTAAWLAVGGLPFIENLQTYGKQEPRHALAWVFLAGVLFRVCEQPVRGLKGLLLGLGAGLACVLSKETGVLLAAPALLVVVLAFRGGRLTGRPAPGAAWIATWAALPALAVAVPLVLLSRGGGSYAQTHLMAGGKTLLHWRNVFGLDPVAGALIAAGVAAALWLPLRATGARRAGLLSLSVAFATQLCFFIAVPNMLTYYLLPPAMIAAILAGAAAVRLFSSPWRWAGALPVVVLVAAGMLSAARYAAAFAGWSWLYARLGDAVAAGRPARVFFRDAGSYEVHVEAGLSWRELRGIPVEVGVLGCSRPEPGVTCVEERDLAPPDWIIEEFGEARCNPRIPVRDFGVARSVASALVGTGRSALPAELVSRFRAGFRCPADLVSARPTFLEWRIYRVTASPRIAWPDLPPDGWMLGGATLLVRAGAERRLQLPAAAFLPAGKQNLLAVRNGNRTLVVCPATAAASDCTIPLEFPPSADPASWVELRLVPATCHVPREYGLGDDSRCLSFNLAAARDLGEAILSPDNPPQTAPAMR